MNLTSHVSLALLLVFGGSLPGQVNDNLDVRSKSYQGYEQPVTFDHTKVGADLTDFPVLINATNAAWKDWANRGHIAKQTAGDVFFTASDHVTRLAHEIESFSPSTGTLVAWVRVPLLSHSADTVIYMRYGTPRVADEWNPAGVWDAGYRLVNHMDDSRYSSSVTKDSTANWNDGGKVSATHPAIGQGRIGNCQAFDGSSDCLSHYAILDTSYWPITGYAYHASLAGNGRLLYAIGRNLTTPSAAGAAEVDPYTGAGYMGWNDGTWAANCGPEAIYKLPAGTYLISDEDAASQWYEMWGNGYKAWNKVGYGLTRSATIGGTNLIIRWGTGASVGYVWLHNAADRSILYQTNAYTYANNGDVRRINGTNYIITADYLAHKLWLLNVDNSAIDWTADLSVTAGPYSAEFIDDNTLLVADGSDYKVTKFTLAPNATNWQSAALYNNGTTIYAHMVDQTHALVAHSLPGISRIDTTEPNGYDDALRFTGALTLQAWVNPSGSGVRYFVDKYKAWNLYCNNQTLAGILNDTKVVTWSSQVTNGVWTHVAMTYDGANIVLYRNGVAGTPSAYTTAISTTQPSHFAVGKQGGGTAYWFPGSIDEVRVSNAVRSGDWLAAEYANQSSPATFYSLGSEEKR